MKPIRNKWLRLALELAIDYEESYYDSWQHVDDDGAKLVKQKTLNNIRQFKKLLGEKPDKIGEKEYFTDMQDVVNALTESDLP